MKWTVNVILQSLAFAGALVMLAAAIISHHYLAAALIAAVCVAWIVFRVKAIKENW